MAERDLSSEVAEVFVEAGLLGYRHGGSQATAVRHTDGWQFFEGASIRYPHQIREPTGRPVGRPRNTKAQCVASAARKRAMNAVRAATDRARRIGAGLCVICGHTPPLAGTRRCETCKVARRNKG